jgi:DNA-binding transcriptional LysR family regulator
MVLDSQEVILRMVETGLGASIVPLSDDVLASLSVTALPFGEPQLIRRLVLLERQDRSKGRMSAALAQAVMETRGRSAPRSR